MSIVRRMDHFTIVTDDGEKTKDFYAQLGLQPGARPNFAVNGFWLYGPEGRPILHVIEVKNMPNPRRGALDHMAFWGEDMPKTIAWLKEKNIEYRLMRAPEPFNTWQLFFPDPNGVEVEIDFTPDEAQPAEWKGNVMRPRN